MQFIVIKSFVGSSTKKPVNTAYLIEDNWDDWFKYQTTYSLYITDENGEVQSIGQLKIGQFDMETNQRRASIPSGFSRLEGKFFSLGQDSHYYENLKNLGIDTRISVLTNLNDIAFNKDLFEKCYDLDVAQSSLFRYLSKETVSTQFRRIANGGVRLTNYNFEYKSNAEIQEQSMRISFDVIPESLPPTNIHVIIGRNGVGKTFLIENIAESLINQETSVSVKGKTYFVDDSNEQTQDRFSHIIFVSFSAFDSKRLPQDSPKFTRIGLPEFEYSESEGHKKEIIDDFLKSFKICVSGPQNALLKRTLEALESDSLFAEEDVLRYCDKDGFEPSKLAGIFNKLSSGHKIILLTVTRLVEKVQEKTLVLFDEPEGHLHPPLLSAFIRSLSELLTDNNGVAIITTHSPVILQEVPKSCVWILRRQGNNSVAERPSIETFGTDITSLTSEVFGLEITSSGYSQLLKKIAEQVNDYDEVLSMFNRQIGSEGRALLRTMIELKNRKDQNNE